MRSSVCLCVFVFAAVQGIFSKLSQINQIAKETLVPGALTFAYANESRGSAGAFLLDAWTK